MDNIEYNMIEPIEGTQIAKDKVLVSALLKAIDRAQGNCPCVLPMARSADTVCPCLKYRTTGDCTCGLFEKVGD